MRVLAAVLAVCSVLLVDAATAQTATAQDSRTIPASVDSTCSKDVTAQVVAFASGGGKLQPGGCYIVNQKLLVGGVLDGQGATIRKTVEETKCKQHAGITKLSSGSTLKNVTLERQGGPGGYDACHYAEHGIEIIGASNTTVSNVTESRVRGDCLYMQGVDGVQVKDLDCKSNGRQGGAISRGQNVHIDGFKVENSSRSGFDFEANSANDVLKNIEIEHFDFTAKLIAFPSQGYNSPQDNISIHDGVVRQALSFVYDRQVRPSSNSCRGSVTRKNWRVESVLVAASVGAYGPGSAVFCGTENATFKGVSMPGGYVVFEGSSGNLVAADSCVKEVRTLTGQAPQQSNITNPPCGTPPPTTSTTPPTVPPTSTPTSTSKPPPTTAPELTPEQRLIQDLYISLRAYCREKSWC